MILMSPLPSIFWTCGAPAIAAGAPGEALPPLPKPTDKITETKRTRFACRKLLCRMGDFLSIIPVDIPVERALLAGAVVARGIRGSGESTLRFHPQSPSRRGQRRLPCSGYGVGPP